MLPDDQSLRILIVATDPLTRAGLASLLGEVVGCDVIGQVSGDEDWTTHIDTYLPDVVLWDVGWEVDTLPDILADTLSELTNSETGLPIVALLPDDSLVGTLYGIGITALLPREAAIDLIVSALHAAAYRLVVVDPDFAAGLLRPAPPPDAPTEDLTPREMDVLQLIAEGLSNRAIGRQLDISEHTVKFHVTAIMTKLGAQSRTEAVVRATRSGLIIL